MGNLQTPEKVRKLQRALYAKAKESPGYRFYLLYDKVYRADLLEHAYRCCKDNDGAAGVDGERFEDIEANGRERWLGERSQELREKRYRPQAVRRVWIDKGGGKKRPLGIPTIRDRVVQMAAVLVLGPIFEADFEPEQYGYRPKRSALDAVRHVHRLLNSGHTEVVDADLSGYFDSIPHSELMKSVARRVSDGNMLKLIKMWLKAPVKEDKERGGGGSKRQSKATEDNEESKGTPQGAPISPLLSNLYMRRFIRGWKKLGYEEKLEAHIVNYADDFVICCRKSGSEAMTAMLQIMGRLKLMVNESKTHLSYVPEEHFDFLGYTLGRYYSAKTGKPYIGTAPSRKRIERICRKIHEQTHRKGLLRRAEELTVRLNRILVGWSQYFCLGGVSKAYRAVDAHAQYRLRQWLCAKHKVQGSGIQRFPDTYLYQELGLIQLTQRTRNFPWAKT